MQYRTGAGGDSLSVLGYGCMRFTAKNGKIDVSKAERELLAAMDGGVNYLDTAYIYSGSEETLGEILTRNRCRERVYLATKLPQYLVKTAGGLDKYLNEQLRRLQTPYIDYYLMHMMTDYAQWEKLERLGVRQWIERKKAAGQIRHIGFSFHGNTETFLSILNAYDWDFCQIQYNYMDEYSQAGRRGLKAAAERGLPVIIMEPLRGGRLVNMLPENAKRAVAANERGYSAAEWGLRWLWDQPEVTTVLSGMNSLEMVRENVRIASETNPGTFTPADFEMIDTLRRQIGERTRVACTGCGYCQPCPQGVDIPNIFRCYNAQYLEAPGNARKEYWRVIGMRQKEAGPSACVGCGLCEGKCPQKITIRQQLKAAGRELEGPAYRIARAGVKLWKPW